ncbi:hypothetical protein MSAN_01593400 [Mycena sanguinolenta]|uniref:Uncharacterized protein n=1 Tax=Mycena sanguinolenta TaxID=230812 RepID=A0A8H7CV43_9AGAR|nr:hypothetical protein MSAN_01593400 [Mycena sanguinolenta]
MAQYPNLTDHGMYGGMAAIPAIHVRQRQTAPWPPEILCFADAPNDCLAPLSAYERHVKELRPNHTETIGLYGPWYSTFIDAVIHSAAYGFVGTDTSTASIPACRQVSSRGGIADMVKWGKPHADDH